MQKILVLLFLTLSNYVISQNIENEINDFAKTYSTVRYFYPEPALNNFDWNSFLIYNSYMFLQEDSSYKYNESINQIAPLSYFSDTISTNLDSLNRNDLANYYYWQHMGRVVDTKSTFYSFHNDIINDYSRDYYEPYKYLNLKKNVGDSIKIEFKAKFKSESNDSVYFIIKADSKGNSALVYENKIKINNNKDWRHYKIEDIFCSDCKTDFYSYLIIERPAELNNLLIDSVLITNITDGTTIYEDNFLTINNERDKYNLSPFYNYIPTQDSCKNILNVKGKWYSFYEQKDLSKEISIELTNNNFTIPRYINTKHKVDKISHKSINLNDEDSVKAFYISDIINLYTIIYNSFPYKKIRENAKIETLFKNSVNRIIDATEYTYEDHVYNIIYFMSAFNDPHFQISKVSTGFLPFRIKKYGKKYIVDNVKDSQYESYRGKEIFSVNGIKINNYIKTKLALNANVEMPIWTELLLNKRFSDKPITLGFKNSEVIIADFKNDYTVVNGYIKDRMIELPDTSFALLNNKAAFFSNKKHSKISDDELVRLINNSDYIIIDFRKYRSDMPTAVKSLLYFKAIKNDLYFTNSNVFHIKSPFQKDIVFYQDTMLETIRHFYLDKIGNYHDLDIPKHIYILVDENVLSNKEYLFLKLYEKDLITLIGTKTAGSIGFATKIDLMSKMRIHFTSGYGTWSDGKSYQNTGMEPHYYVESKFHEKLTVENDEVFLKAKELIKKEIEKEENNSKPTNGTRIILIIGALITFLVVLFKLFKNKKSEGVAL